MDYFISNLENFFGSVDKPFIALIVFIAIDFITGIIKGYVTKELSSKIGKDGLLRKSVIFMVIVLAHVVDLYIIKQGAVLRTMVILFYIAEEGLSIIENCGAIGIPIPQKLVDAIKVLKKK
jgi:toxin secretion/phage lysis holin